MTVPALWPRSGPVSYTHLDVYKRQFENSRVTGPDSLRVSRLPAADKGGKWEVCVICDGIEPAVVNLSLIHI